MSKQLVISMFQSFLPVILGTRSPGLSRQRSYLLLGLPHPTLQATFPLLSFIPHLFPSRSFLLHERVFRYFTLSFSCFILLNSDRLQNPARPAWFCQYQFRVRRFVHCVSLFLMPGGKVLVIDEHHLAEALLSLRILPTLNNSPSEMFRVAELLHDNTTRTVSMDATVGFLEIRKSTSECRTKRQKVVLVVIRRSEKTTIFTRPTFGVRARFCFIFRIL